MENVQQKQKGSNTSGRRLKKSTLAEKIKSIKKENTIMKRDIETKKKFKQFRWPFKWKMKFRRTAKAENNDKMLVFFLNKKNQIETPKYMPLFDGNMIVWKNKPYEFDPRAVWTIQGIRKNPQCYILKEIDRRPVRNAKGRGVYADAAVSNLNVDEIKERGDSTDSDEFLIKAALKAQVTQARKQMSKGALIAVVILIVAGLIWFMSSGSGT